MRKLLAVITSLITSVFVVQSATAAMPLLEAAVDGGRLQGRSDATVASFQGIRYAAPPVGDLRWRAPQPVAP